MDLIEFANRVHEVFLLLEIRDDQATIRGTAAFSFSSLHRSRLIDLDDAIILEENPDEFAVRIAEDERHAGIR